MFETGLVTGLMIGFTLGFVVCALLTMGRWSCDEIDGVERKK